MTRRTSRVDAPPPRPQGSQPAFSAEHAMGNSRSTPAVLWGGSYAGSSATSSPQEAPTEKEANQSMAAEFFPASPDPQCWGKDPRPLGGFLNYLQHASPFPVAQQFPQNVPMPPNFPFSGGPVPAYCLPTDAPQSSMSKRKPSPPSFKSSNPHMSSSSQPQQNINVDVDTGNENADIANEDEVIRTSRRLIWTKEEDLRLVYERLVK
ncbi:hypothetical protein ACP70R_002239 [Stipagrostis hirtigluma subsp. patula]